MSELDEKLNSILSSPGEMEKLMGIAKELSGSLGLGGGAPHKEEIKKEAFPLGELGDIDPKIFGIVSRLMGEYSSRKEDKKDIVESLKPYLKKERRGDLDRAVKIARLAHVAKTAFSEFGGDLHL